MLVYSANSFLGLVSIYLKPSEVTLTVRLIHFDNTNGLQHLQAPDSLWSRLPSVQSVFSIIIILQAHYSSCSLDTIHCSPGNSSIYPLATLANLLVLFFFKFIYLLIYFRERAQVGKEQEKERQNPKQALHHQCRARCGVQTHKLRDYDLS